MSFSSKGRFEDQQQSIHWRLHGTTPWPPSTSILMFFDDENSMM